MSQSAKPPKKIGSTAKQPGEKSNRTKSSGRWLEEHFSDAYVQRAQIEGWRSRAAFKLEQIDLKDKLFQQGMAVVDLGAAPGGWSQYAGKRIGSGGRVIASDILPMDPLPDVAFVLGDFREPQPLAELTALLNGKPVDLVISDMAPNMSGNGAVDQPASMYLAELAMDFAQQNLRGGGQFLVKIFQGEGFDEYLRAARSNFNKVLVRKPDASRSRSREVYLLAKGLK